PRATCPSPVPYATLFRSLGRFGACPVPVLYRGRGSYVLRHRWIATPSAARRVESKPRLLRVGIVIIWRLLFRRLWVVARDNRSGMFGVSVPGWGDYPQGLGVAVVTPVPVFFALVTPGT